MSARRDRTLLVVKPDAFRRRLVGAIVARIEGDGFEIRDVCLRRLTRADAERFYAVHRGKPFFDGLVEFMASGPAIALLLERAGAAARLRELVGATDPGRARPDTIRGQFGTSVRENAVHASNPDEDPQAEIRFYFPDRALPGPV